VAQSAKQFFYMQRKEVASDVRGSVGNWKAEAAEGTARALNQAQSNREKAHSWRRAASAKQEELRLARAEAAELKRQTMEAKLKELSRDQNAKEEALKLKHDETFTDKFVDMDAAEQLANSNYEQLSHDGNRGIGGGGSVLRGNWNPMFKSSGWFASWFAGPAIESTTI